MNGNYNFKNEGLGGSPVLLDELYLQIFSNFIELLYKENRYRVSSIDEFTLYFLEKVRNFSHRKLRRCSRTLRNCSSSLKITKKGHNGIARWKVK